MRPDGTFDTDGLSVGFSCLLPAGQLQYYGASAYSGGGNFPLGSKELGNDLPLQGAGI